jgi:hypothetical protein
VEDDEQQAECQLWGMSCAVFIICILVLVQVIFWGLSNDMQEIREEHQLPWDGVEGVTWIPTLSAVAMANLDCSSCRKSRKF